MQGSTMVQKHYELQIYLYLSSFEKNGYKQNKYKTQF